MFDVTAELRVGKRGTLWGPLSSAPLFAHAEPLEVLGDAEHQGLTRSRGERGVSEGAEGCFWFCGATEASRRIQGSCDVVVCAGRVRIRGVEPASPGTLGDGMSLDPTGRNHIHHERGSGRGTFGSTKNAARPGTDSALSAAPRDKKLRGSV